MRFFFRWAFRLLIFLLVLGVAGILLLDTIARAITEYRIRSRTGMDVRIGRMEIGLLYPQVTIENLLIYNSGEFGGSPFIEMPELHLEYDRDALFSRKLHCHLVRLNLNQVNVVENRKGRTNIEALEKRAALPAGSPSTGKPAPGPRLMGCRFTGIDTLNLTLGKATYMRMKQPAEVEELNMNIRNQVLTNVTSAQDLGGVLVVVLLKNGVNVMGSGNGTPDSGLQSWLQRLMSPAKK
jgi:hypothetical protein